MNENDVEGFKVGENERQVVLTLTHPAAYLPDMMTMTAFSPRPEEYDKFLPGSAELAQATVSSGPYKITAYEPTKKIRFERNPAWDGNTDEIRKAYVDTVVVNQTVTQESAQQQLETGTPNADMEFDNFPPPSRIPALRASNDEKLNLGFTASTNPYVVYNHVSPNEKSALAKLEVRQALNHAINRDNLIQALGGPDVNPPLTHVLPSSLVGGEEDFDLYPHDPDKAKQMLADAGYPNGFTLKVLYRNESEGSRKVFQTLQQDLDAVGVKVQGVASPSADFYTKYLQVPDVAKRGVWDAAVAGWGADWYGNAALSYFKPLFSGEEAFPPNGSNFGFYKSEETNALIEQAVAAKTEDEAADLWHQADEQVMKDAAFFPITNPKQPNYHAEQVKNAQYIPGIQNFDPTNVWLDPAKNGG